MRPTTKSYEIATRENFEPTRKSFGHTKYPRKKTLDTRNTHKKKIGTHEIPARKYYPREKTLYTRNTRKKEFGTYEIPARKCFGPTKYSRRHNGTMVLDPQGPQWHVAHEI